MLSTTSRITCFVHDLPVYHSIASVEYSDGALDAEVNNIIKRLGYVTRTRKPAAGVTSESTYLYSAMATVKMPEESIHDFLRFAKWGFDVVVEYKSGDVDLCDALLDCVPIYGVANQILCSVEHVVWNGVYGDPEPEARWQKLREEAERHHSRGVAAQAR